MPVVPNTFPTEWQVRLATKDLMNSTEPRDGELATDFKARVQDLARAQVAAEQAEKLAAQAALDDDRCPKCDSALHYVRYEHHGDARGHWADKSAICRPCGIHWSTKASGPGKESEVITSW